MRFLKWGAVFILSFCIFWDPSTGRNHSNYNDNFTTEALFKAYARYMHSELELNELDYNVFEMALKGYLSFKRDSILNNDQVLSIADFNKSGKKERFFVIDIKRRKVLYKSLVAHGRNSGFNFARNFSNTPESYKSSLGFYITNETYWGKHGLSLRLDGQESFFNNNARKRDIVIHGADYVSEEFIRSRGYLGRSFGCPALPVNVSKEIIETIKDKSCLFIFYPDNDYLNTSPILSNLEIEAEFYSHFNNAES